MDLPTEYQQFDETTQTRDITPLAWELVEDGMPSDGTACDEELGWIWAHAASSPRVWLFICEVGDAEQASSLVASTDLEEIAAVDLQGVYEAVAIPADELGLAADEVRIACVWGTPEDCRGWISLARYGSLVVTVQFAATSPAGILGTTAFTDLVQSIDEHVGS